jgi:aspartyl-tRNA(Asn)/glutamyl-tRNA(Gln) amidotransferase subunit B
MRSKEEAHDYRYFPEPDLPPLVVRAEQVTAIRDAMPDLPDARRQRFVAAHGLPEYDALQLTQSRALAEFFEAAVAAGAGAKAASNWMMGELARALKESGLEIARSPVRPAQLAELLGLIANGTISGAIAKGVFETMFASGRAAGEIVRTQGLTQIDDEAEIVRSIEAVLGRHADAVLQYRAGKAAAFGFLVGQVMKATAGKANPKRVNELLKLTLDARPAS